MSHRKEFFHAAFIWILLLLQSTLVAADTILRRPEDVEEENHPRNLRQRAKKQYISCLYLEKNVHFRGNPTGPRKSMACELRATDSFRGTVGQIVNVKGLPATWVDNNREKLKSGNSMLTMPDSFLDGENIYAFPGIAPTVTRGKGHAFVRRNVDSSRRKLGGPASPIVGNKKVLAIRVKAPDSVTSSSLAAISNEIFGTSGDQMNMRSQYAACSYGQLSLDPFSGTTSTSEEIQDGVVEVSINVNVNGATDDDIRNAVTSAADSMLGNLPEQFDFVMLCLPPGTRGEWGAYAYTDYWLSVYNDDECNYPSGQMHEIGHNLGLDHSNENFEEYEDESGLMGSSYYEDDGPLMCFNGAKSWQLGWYAAANTIVKPLESPWNGLMVGIVDYNDGNTGGKIAILKIETGTSSDYYVSFNRKSGINSGTNEGGDMVLVQSQGHEGTNSSFSELEAKLDSEQQYSINNFGGNEGTTVIIQVNSINLGASPSVADVSVYVEGNPPTTTSTTAAATTATSNPPITTTTTANPPTATTTSTGATTAPTTTNACPAGQASIEVIITTDDYPDETTWNVKNSCTNEILMTGGPYSSSGVFDKRQCVPSGKYIFTIADSAGDGICCGEYGDGSYLVRLSNQQVASGGQFGSSESKTFGNSACPTATTAVPTSSTATTTTSAIVAPTTSNPCPVGEASIEVIITTDDYPEETSWNVKNSCTDETLMTGGPYSSTGVFDEQKCVPDGQYIFTIEDSEGDGICCGEYGDGSYSVKLNDQQVAGGGEFWIE